MPSRSSATRVQGGPCWGAGLRRRPGRFSARPSSAAKSPASVGYARAQAAVGSAIREQALEDALARPVRGAVSEDRRADRGRAVEHDAAHVRAVRAHRSVVRCAVPNEPPHKVDLGGAERDAYSLDVLDDLAVRVVLEARPSLAHAVGSAARGAAAR